jgi:hypothetical protein
VASDLPEEVRKACSAVADASEQPPQWIHRHVAAEQLASALLAECDLRYARKEEPSIRAALSGETIARAHAFANKIGTLPGAEVWPAILDWCERRYARKEQSVGCASVSLLGPCRAKAVEGSKYCAQHRTQAAPPPPPAIEGAWQPIATAPWSELVLVCGPSGYCRFSVYYQSAYRDREHRGDSWLDVTGDRLSDTFGTTGDPTHWMPLPLARAAREAGL